MSVVMLSSFHRPANSALADMCQCATGSNQLDRAKFSNDVEE